MNTNIDILLDAMKKRTAPESSYRSMSLFRWKFFSEIRKVESGKNKTSEVRKIAESEEPTIRLSLGSSLDRSLFTSFSCCDSHVQSCESDFVFQDIIPDRRDSFSRSCNSFCKRDCCTGESLDELLSAGLASDFAELNFENNSTEWNTEEYKPLDENGFQNTAKFPLSTFGADVDTATYTKVRRSLLQRNSLPPKDAVRTEEFLNYFSYDYKAPQGDADFHVNFESVDAPWSPDRKLLLVGVQAKEMEKNDLPPSNFVFLIDTSGSMRRDFPLVIEAMETLADQLRDDDRISIVTYGGSGVNVMLDGRSGADRAGVKEVIRTLNAAGCTPGGEGIQKAYKLAHKHFIKGGNNRIVLITDGDFNVGDCSESALVQIVEKERRSAIYLSVFGVGMGNYKDNKLKMLANKGNGNYSYLDNVREAKRVMVNEMTGRMFTLGKDVKFQIEFNPAKVAGYRLIGYELRKMADRDFNDDTKDSGEVGIGHQVTAMYELIMADADAEVKAKYLGSVDELKYQTTTEPTGSDDILTFKLRYQKPEGNEPSRLLTFELKELPDETDNIRWASAVTEFSLLLRNSEYKGCANFRNLRTRAQKALGMDPDGKRAEFLTLVKIAEDLQK